MKGLLEVELLVRGDGALCGAYLKLGTGKVARTEVIEADVVLADYDKYGSLVGIDLLAATKISVVIGLVKDPEQKTAIRRLVRRNLGDLLQAA